MQIVLKQNRNKSQVFLLFSMCERKEIKSLSLHKKNKDNLVQQDLFQHVNKLSNKTITYKRVNLKLPLLFNSHCHC